MKQYYQNNISFLVNFAKKPFTQPQHDTFNYE